MARQLYQLAAVQDTFAARIRQKVQDQRESTIDRVEEIPLFGKLLAPFAGLVFDIDEGINTAKGERGEESVLDAVLRALPASWYVFHNVVVEPQPDDFAQIDLRRLGRLLAGERRPGALRPARDGRVHRRAGGPALHRAVL